MKTLLLMTEDKNWKNYMTLLLNEPQFRIIAQQTVEDSVKCLQFEAVDVVITDEPTLLDRAMALQPPTPTIVFYPTQSDRQTELLKRGAVVALAKSEAYLLPLMLTKLLD